MSSASLWSDEKPAVAATARALASAVLDLCPSQDDLENDRESGMEWREQWLGGRANAELIGTNRLPADNFACKSPPDQSRSKTDSATPKPATAKLNYRTRAVPGQPCGRLRLISPPKP